MMNWFVRQGFVKMVVGCVFILYQILDLIIKPIERNWKSENIALLKKKAQQYSLFDSVQKVEKEFLTVDKLPYKFSYRFTDDVGKKSTLMIEDWEIGALYWNCLKSSHGDEKEAIKLVKQKYFDEFSKKDIYLFLGTTRRYHGWATNPFIIIGVFYPPHTRQFRLL